MREVDSPQMEDPYFTVIINFFNNLFGTTDASIQFWNNTITSEIKKRFDFPGSIPENISKKVDRLELFLRISAKLQLKWNEDTMAVSRMHPLDGNHNISENSKRSQQLKRRSYEGPIT